MNNIRELRLQKGMSQDKLSEITGFKKCFISKIENGYHAPKQRTIERLEAAFGTKITWVEDDLKLRSASFYACQKVLKRLVEMKIGLTVDEQQELSKIVKKYFI